MQHTLGHIDCTACDATRHVLMQVEELARYTFTEAATLWLDTRRHKLAPATVKHYEDCLTGLTPFFGAMLLRDVHIGHINTYQLTRQAAIRTSKQHIHSKRGAAASATDGASRINHEISTLALVLQRAALWDPLGKFYEPLPLPKESPGVALESEEEAHFFEVASSKKRWLLAYCADLLSNATTAGPNEIRHLRLKDIDEVERTIHIQQGTKNEFRVRRVPCNDDAWWAVEQLLARAKKLGACRPEHYLMPHRAKKKGEAPDLLRPMGSWKRAHYAIRTEAAKRFPQLSTLRMYDFRHSATTKLLENPEISERTVEEIVGHRLGSKVKERYSHIRMMARRSAADALNSGHRRAVPPKKQPARDTADVRTTHYNVIMRKPAEPAF